MRAVAPFLMVPPSLVSLGDWELNLGQDWVPLPDVLPEWDYNTDLRLRRTAGVDRNAARLAVGLSIEAELAWLVSWRATDSKLAGSAALQMVTDDSTLISVVVPGRELGAALNLYTRLVLASEADGATPGAPRHAGSVVAEHSQRVILQGDLGQFPVALVDFARCGLDPDSSFVVEIAGDPSTPVLCGIQLLINSRDIRLVDAISGRDASPAATELVSVMEEDVGTQLLDHIVRHYDEFSSDVWEDDTIGQAGLELVRRIDSIQGLKSLSDLRETNYVAYRTLLVGEARRNGLGRRISS